MTSLKALIKETKKVLLMPHQVTEIEAISEEMLSMNKESVLKQVRVGLCFCGACWPV